MSDLLAVAAAVVKLVRGLELDEAARRVAEARVEASRKSQEERARNIDQIHRTLRGIQTQRAALREAVASVPERERAHAALRVEQVLDDLFDVEESELRAAKRRLARPR